MRRAVLQSALVFGLIVGALRALLQGADVVIMLDATNQGYPDTPDSQVFSLLLLVALASLILFLVNLGLYLLAGMFAARQTGSVGSGSIAGMLAGALAGVIGAAISIGTYATGLLSLAPTGPSPLSPTDFELELIVVEVSAVLGIAFDIGFGAGMGALGGLIGRSTYEKTHPVAPLAGLYAPAWVYAPGAFPPPPGYGPAYSPAPYTPYPAYAPTQQPGEPWPATYPPPLGYIPPPPPLPPPPSPPAGPASTEAATPSAPAADQQPGTGDQ